MKNFVNTLEYEDYHILEKLTNGKHNVIFGAGAVGSILKKSLDELNIPVYSFLVNDNQRKNKTYLGISVYELSEFLLEANECNIFYAIRSKERDIIEPLRKKVSKNIIYIDCIEDISMLRKLYYINYLNEKNINIKARTLNLNGLKIINPFNKQLDYLYSWLCEVGDLILPKAMKDFSQIDEGPYEYGAVALEEGDVVFDCGANIGLFSAVAAHNKCKVYSFEPFEEVQKYLKETSDLYPELINICPYALSNEIGDTKFYILDNYIGVNSIIETDMNKDYEHTIKVRMTTMDDFIKTNNITKVDFIKADIEGAERLMLMGARETLKRFGPKIAICTYHLKDDPQVLENIIRDTNPNYIIEHRWKKLYAYIPNKTK